MHPIPTARGISSRSGFRLLLAAFFAALPVSPLLAACYDASPSPRFVLRGGEAFDQATGLTWKRCSVGRVWDGQRCTGTTSYLALDEARELAKGMGGGWHVPSGAELESIIDLRCGSPVVDPKVFPDIATNDEGEAPYWTVSEVGMANLFYFFDFLTGNADGHTAGFSLAVRLVRQKSEPPK